MISVRKFEEAKNFIDSFLALFQILQISWSTFKAFLLGYHFLCFVIKDSDILSYISKHLYSFFIVLLSSPNMDDDVFKCAILFQAIVLTIRTMKRVIGYPILLELYSYKKWSDRVTLNFHSFVYFHWIHPNTCFIISIIGNRLTFSNCMILEL